MAEKLLLTVLEISIASSLVILLLLLASPLLGKRYSPKLRCLIWLVLAVRLIMPVNMPWQHALQINLFPEPEAQAAQYDWFIPNPAQILENESGERTDHQDALPKQEPAHYKTVKATPIFVLAAIWAAGMILFLLYHLGAYFYTLHRLRRWSTPVQDEETLNRLVLIKKELSLRNEIQLYKSAKAASPLLLGFVHPRMILPEKPLAPGQLDFMLRHELWHLKRGDLWYKLLMLLANAVHWFNPLVWLMDKQANLDTELSCDTDVLQGADSDKRKAYGYTILSFMDQGWRCKTPLMSRFYGGKVQMKRRFYNIADASNKKRGTLLFCAIALIITLAGCAVHTSESAEQSQLPRASQEDAEKFDMRVSAFIPDDTEQQEAQNKIAELQPEFASVPVNQNEIAELYNLVDWTKDPYTGGEMTWPFPDNTRIIQPYGKTPLIENYHTGIDIAGEYGEVIVAANDGTVKFVSETWNPGVGYGMYVILDHGGETTTLYAHCSGIVVSEGDRVVKGQKIAEAGATGFASEPHLHFEVRLTGETVAPMPYITSNGFVWPTIDGYISEGVGAYPGHTGMDIAGQPEGTPVYAAAAGTVVNAQDTDTGYGKYIIVDHGNDYQTLYANNSELYVSVGDILAQGQTIAAVGSSGSATNYQLHFEIRHNGRILDPEDYLTAPSEPNPQ